MPKEYQITIRQPGRSFRVRHNFTDGSSATYIVRITSPFRIECSCPAYRYLKGRGPCKHCRYIANLIGKPELVDQPPF